MVVSFGSEKHNKDSHAIVKVNYFIKLFLNNNE
jgi:hypothetical protein